jgi:hypothetical protein
MLGDERMTAINCHCGAKYDRVASHKKEALGFTCSWCQTKWRTHAVIKGNGQTALFFSYYECTCGSNILNIPPKIARCHCPVVDLR